MMETKLPSILPVFSMSGLVLLPRARLPLNIVEPRYISLVDAALGQGRMIGLVQSTSGEDTNPAAPFYQVGCAGRISSFSETDDGRYLISLNGVCRFSCKEELPLLDGYRRIVPDWQDFQGDLTPVDEGQFDRGHLLEILRHYFKMFGIVVDWNAIQSTTDEMLIASLTMICPLEPNEKQALLEAPDLKVRAELLTALLEMASLPQGEAETARH